jgi:hypothetical protein
MSSDSDETMIASFVSVSAKLSNSSVWLIARPDSSATQVPCPSVTPVFGIELLAVLPTVLLLRVGELPTTHHRLSNGAHLLRELASGEVRTDLV